jgi:hypothetical protein
MSDQQKFKKAMELMDQANSEDPNLVEADGKSWPKELLYSHRMSDMLQRFKPDTDDAMKLAIHAQHIQRWKTPRDSYPEGRAGYLQWRTGLYKFHAETAAQIMEEAQYDQESIDRAKKAIGKKALKVNRDSQLLEDIADLVFIEHYMLEFAEKHPEYSEEKWLDIIRKTWAKMSQEAQDYALSGAVTLPQPLVPLIQKALAG